MAICDSHRLSSCKLFPSRASLLRLLQLVPFQRWRLCQLCRVLVVSRPRFWYLGAVLQMRRNQSAARSNNERVKTPKSMMMIAKWDKYGVCCHWINSLKCKDLQLWNLLKAFVIQDEENELVELPDGSVLKRARKEEHISLQDALDRVSHNRRRQGYSAWHKVEIVGWPTTTTIESCSDPFNKKCSSPLVRINNTNLNHFWSNMQERGAWTTQASCVLERLWKWWSQRAVSIQGDDGQGFVWSARGLTQTKKFSWTCFVAASALGHNETRSVARSVPWLEYGTLAQNEQHANARFSKSFSWPSVWVSSLHLVWPSDGESQHVLDQFIPSFEQEIEVICNRFWLCSDKFWNCKYQFLNKMSSAWTM